MAEIQTTTLIDDLTGKHLEPEKADRIFFAVDGRSYRIDLDQAGAEEFRNALAPYIKVASSLGTTSTRGRRAARTASRGSGEQTKMREWAREQGLKVADRGRIPAEIQEQYRAAH